MGEAELLLFKRMQVYSVIVLITYYPIKSAYSKDYKID